MTTTHTETFDAPEPLQLDLRHHDGDVEVRAVETTTARVVLDGLDHHEVAACTMTLAHGRLVVDVPPVSGGAGGAGLTLAFGSRRYALGGRGREVTVAVELPLGSSATIATTSGDVSCTGSLDEVRVKTGSGDVRVEQARTVAAVAGSGDVSITGVAESAQVNTGSGDVWLDRADSGAAVELLTGSGDITVRRLADGRCRAMAASGDILLGVVAGVAVWTDVTTTSGDISSDLGQRGTPAKGEPYAEISATSVSGDVTLHTA